jgi:hypothetical protein
MTMKHTGNLTITRENADRYAGLTEVTGTLYIHNDAKLDAPALTSVGGYLCILTDTKLDALTSVGGRLYIHTDAKLDAPALTTLAGHDLPPPDVAAQRLRDVAAAALLTPQSLDMGEWHTCETTHCVAGWAIHQAGPDGYALEAEVGPSAAGTVLLGLEAAHHFHVSDAKAREWLAGKLEVQP